MELLLNNRTAGRANIEPIKKMSCEVFYLANGNSVVKGESRSGRNVTYIEMKNHPCVEAALGERHLKLLG